jgi:hypothetical protein
VLIIAPGALVVVAAASFQAADRWLPLAAPLAAVIAAALIAALLARGLRARPERT